MSDTNSWNDTDFAARAVAEARARCDAAIADAEALRAGTVALRAELDEARAMLRGIDDAVGGVREGETLVDAVRRVEHRRAQMFAELKAVDAAVCRSDAEDLVDAVRRVAGDRDMARAGSDGMRRQIDAICALVGCDLGTESLVDAVRMVVRSAKLDRANLEKASAELEEMRSREAAREDEDLSKGCEPVKVCDCLAVVRADCERCSMCGYSFQRRALQKPERVEVGQWWTWKRERGGVEVPFRIIDEEASQSLIGNADAVYLGNGERPLDPSATTTLPKPDAVRSGQLWRVTRYSAPSMEVRSFNHRGQAELYERRAGYAPFLADPLEMLTSDKWTYLGESERPDRPRSTDRSPPHPLAEALRGLTFDEWAALNAAGWVMRWTAPSVQWVTPGGAALDPATWRETLRREAARLLGRRYVPESAGAQSEEARMGEAKVSGCGYCGDAGCHEVAAAPETPKEIAERVVSLCGSGDTVVIDVTSQRSKGPRMWHTIYTGNNAAEYARNLRRMIEWLLTDHESLVTAEAREAGRQEAKAEIERLRMVLIDIGRALDHRSPEYITDTADRVVRERDASYQRGQEEMLGRIRFMVTREIDKLEASGGRIDAAPLRRLGEELARIWVEKTPTVSASGEPGEVDPGRGGTETAGAGESVAREGDGGVAMRAEIDRLNRCLRDSMEQLAEESEQWRAATGCETPEAARERMARFNEAAKLLRD